ncbi:MAG: type I 3-dehydroquinate dehydratase [Candidatus Cloacimonetes bacterium]|nr:type I 3-dehydroquinate dehydratase [Candidatus Cloacimonadota bacterium]
MLIYSTNENNFDKCCFKPDMFELRLDLCESTFQIPDFFSDKKTIITLRDISEGGLYEGSLEKRLDFYAELLKHTDFFIDIEFRYFNDLTKMLDIALYKHRIIVSVHDNSRSFFEIDPAWKEIPTPFFFKFVYKIDTLTELYTINNQLKTMKLDYCLLSVGKTSLLSRVLYKKLGSKAVYFGKKGYETAPNQLTDNDVLQYNLQNINKGTKMGGIIGGSQILNSLGLSFYNSFFQRENINSVYLPFLTEDISDIVNFVKNAELDFYGFSITMPFKDKISSMIGKEQEIINLWLPLKNEVFLTDEVGFEKSFHQLNISNQTLIILFGSGAMAETVLKMLPDNDIIIVSRNKKKTEYLKMKYQKNKIIDKIPQREDLCLINATPLGMKGENVLDIYDFKIFNKVIDLPYTENKTKLVEYCEKKGISFVDGKEFWKFQAEEQLKKFML